MLVISRKAEEFLKIGDDIIVKVIKTTNGSVKIGIEAPGEMRVLRGELAEFTPSSLQAISRFWGATSHDPEPASRPTAEAV